MLLQIKDMKHIEWDFVMTPRSCPGVEIGGAQRSKFYILKHGHVAYQIDGDNEKNRTQVNFSS